MSDAPRVSTLGVLVGENPLPAVQAAATLRPHAVRVLHTAESGNPAERLQGVLQRELGIELVDLDRIDRADFAAAVRWGERLSEQPNSHLDYTGGSKLMAVGAAQGFASPARQSNIVAGRRTLIIDDGRHVPMDVALPLRATVELHGRRLEPQDDLPRHLPAGLAGTLADRWRDGQRRRRAKDAARLDDLKAALQRGQHVSLIEAQERILAYLQAMGIASGGVEVADIEDARRWAGFLHGKALEAAALEWLRAVDGTLETAVGVRMPRLGLHKDRYAPEVDVLGSDGTRLLVISCGSVSHAESVRAKATEAVVRARQLGGMHAGVATITYAQDRVRDETQAALTPFGRHRPWVFGASDVAAWARGDLATLRGWIGTP